MHHSLEQFFGGVVICRNVQFRTVNGYPNEYWGWGFQDKDLKERFTRSGIGTLRRKGTFQALAHVNRGFKVDGNPTDPNLRNAILFAVAGDQVMCSTRTPMGLAGLNSKSLNVLHSQWVRVTL